MVIIKQSQKNKIMKNVLSYIGLIIALTFFATNSVNAQIDLDSLDRALQSQATNQRNNTDKFNAKMSHYERKLSAQNDDSELNGEAAKNDFSKLQNYAVNQVTYIKNNDPANAVASEAAINAILGKLSDEFNRIEKGEFGVTYTGFGFSKERRAKLEPLYLKAENKEAKNNALLTLIQSIKDGKLEIKEISNQAEKNEKAYKKEVEKLSRASNTLQSDSDELIRKYNLLSSEIEMYRGDFINFLQNDPDRLTQVSTYQTAINSNIDAINEMAQSREEIDYSANPDSLNLGSFGIDLGNLSTRQETNLLNLALNKKALEEKKSQNEKIHSSGAALRDKLKGWCIKYNIVVSEKPTTFTESGNTETTTPQKKEMVVTSANFSDYTEDLVKVVKKWQNADTGSDEEAQFKKEGLEILTAIRKYEINEQIRKKDYVHIKIWKKDSGYPKPYAK